MVYGVYDMYTHICIYDIYIYIYISNNLLNKFKLNGASWQEFHDKDIFRFKNAVVLTKNG